MRYVITISQAGIHAAGLIGRVSIESVILLTAATRFFLSAKSTRLKAEEGPDFVWLDVGHLLRELPILWAGQKDKTRRNRTSQALRELVAAKLLETRRGSRGRLFVRPTEIALGLETAHRPENRDGTAPKFRDGETPPLYNRRTKGSEQGDARIATRDICRQLRDHYPKHRQAEEEKVVAALNLVGADLPPVAVLLDAIEAFKATTGWIEMDGKFVPALPKWLKERQWEQVAPTTPPAPPEPDPPGWLATLHSLHPNSYTPRSFADLRQDHPDVAAEVLAAIAAAATDDHGGRP